MENKGMKKSTIIIIAIIAIAAIVILSLTVFKEKEPAEYYVTSAHDAAEPTLFKDYASFKKFINKKSIDDTMTNKVTFKKSSFSETFTEEFFANKRLAVIPVYEDTSKEYIYSVDEVIYNSDKTEVTIKYTYKIGTFADVLSSTWYNYMFVELENTVEHVEFVKDNGSSTES